MNAADPATLLLIAGAGVALVVVLITVVRLPAFIALLLGSILFGLAARMPLADIPRAFQEGVGNTLGFVALVIGLGTVIGKLLAESGGAVVVSQALVSALGERRLEWAMLLSGFLIGLPVFFQVGLVLLAPVMFTIAAQTGVPLLRLGIPLIAGLSATHGLVPPHPGPLAAIERLGADPGRTLFYSLIVSLPVAMLVGPPIGRIASRRFNHGAGAIADQFTGARATTRPPSLATLLAFLTFGRACGFDGKRLLQFAEESLPPIASVLLVVGAGGGFGRVLVTAGVDKAIAEIVGGMQLSPLVLAWVIAALLRISVGSSTVSVVTAASIMAPIIASTPGVNRELMVVSIGAGSLIASHVNDGGFWLVKEYLNMSVPETLATWSVLETVISVLGLAGVLLLATVLG